MSSNIVELPFVTADEAVKIIRDIAKNRSEDLQFLDHAVMRSGQRGVTRRQVQVALKDGELMENPEWDTKIEKGWRCKFSAYNSGKKVTVVSKLIKQQDEVCLIVTVWEG